MEWATLSLTPPKASYQKTKLFMSHCFPFMPLFYFGGNQEK